MDELSLLEAESIPEIIAPDSALYTSQAPDFTGSLDFIDSLASRSAITLSQRDLAMIAMPTFNDFEYTPLKRTQGMLGTLDNVTNSITDFRPLGDARRFNPESVRAPRALVRSASRVMQGFSPEYKAPPQWRAPDPFGDRESQWERQERAMNDAKRRVLSNPFVDKKRFSRPNQVLICLKRKIRRSVMHAFGYAGGYGFRPPVRTYWSRIVC